MKLAILFLSPADEVWNLDWRVVGWRLAGQRRLEDVLRFEEVEL